MQKFESMSTWGQMWRPMSGQLSASSAESVLRIGDQMSNAT